MAEKHSSLPRRQPVPNMGCGYAVCVLLLAIGAGLLFAADRKWRGGKKNEAWVIGSVGGLVCLASIGLIRPMKRAVAKARERRAREDARPNEPWTWDERWLDPTGIPQSGHRHAAAMLFSGCVCLLVSLPAMFKMQEELRRENYGVVVALVFPVVGIGFLSVAVLHAVRIRKYGRARFVPAAVPVPHGGEVAGMVIVNRRIVPQRPGRVSLDCYRTSLSRHRNKRRQNEKVVSHTEREIAPADWVDAVGESRAFVQLPVREGQPTTMTALDVDHPTYEWRLRVQVPTAGADFVAEFVVPVFDVSGAAP